MENTENFMEFHGISGRCLDDLDGLYRLFFDTNLLLQIPRKKTIQIDPITYLGGVLEVLEAASGTFWDEISQV